LAELNPTPPDKKKHRKAEAGFRPAGLIYFGSNVCLAKHTFIPNPLYFISNKSLFYIKKIPEKFVSLSEFICESLAFFMISLYN